GIQVNPDDVRNLESTGLKKLLHDKASEMYDVKEAEYPVMAGFYHFTSRDSAGQKRYDRDQLVDWARKRFGLELSEDDVKNKDGEQIRDLLIAQSRASLSKANEAREDMARLVDEVFPHAAGHEGNGSHATAGKTASPAALDKLIAKMQQYEP